MVALYWCRWYSEKFVKGQWEQEDCMAEWEAYRACTSVWVTLYSCWISSPSWLVVGRSGSKNSKEFLNFVHVGWYCIQWQKKSLCLVCYQLCILIQVPQKSKDQFSLKILFIMSYQFVHHDIKFPSDKVLSSVLIITRSLLISTSVVCDIGYVLPVHLIILQCLCRN